jgi:hypothetical protein
VCEYFQLYGQSGMGVQTLPLSGCSSFQGQSAVCEYFQLYGQSGMGVQTLPVCLDVVPFKVLAVSDKA